jgi:hypothetical protein
VNQHCAGLYQIKGFSGALNGLLEFKMGMAMASTWPPVPGWPSATVENGLLVVELNYRGIPGLCLTVVKLPSMGLCRITFAGASGKGNGMMFSR